MSDSIFGRMGDLKNGETYNALKGEKNPARRGSGTPAGKATYKKKLIEINGEQVEAVIKVFGSGEEMLYMVNDQEPDFELSKAFDAGDYKVVGR